MIVVIDNYDSFTYNLVQYLGELGAALCVFRNDAITLGQIRDLAPDQIVISPGPGRPESAGITLEVVRELGPRIPLLGVCLGHQAIGAAFGAEIVPAPVLMHGKVSEIWHDGRALFHSLESPFRATRYHSLIVARDRLPDCFEVSAWTCDGIIMGLRHRHFPIEGVQFHPESILTEMGRLILSNFINLHPAAQPGRAKA